MCKPGNDAGMLNMICSVSMNPRYTHCVVQRLTMAIRICFFLTLILSISSVYSAGKKIYFLVNRMNFIHG
jgi:hypothetical protein